MDRETAHTRLREWILRHGKSIDEATLTDETPIMEKRVITSLQLMDLILLIESMRSASLQQEQIAPGSFRNMTAILDNFFSEALAA